VVTGALYVAAGAAYAAVGAYIVVVPGYPLNVVPATPHVAQLVGAATAATGAAHVVATVGE
jgi:hypothetical protein